MTWIVQSDSTRRQLYNRCGNEENVDEHVPLSLYERLDDIIYWKRRLIN